MVIKPVVQTRNLHYPGLSKHAHQDIRGIIYRIYNTYNGKSYITYEKGTNPSYPIWYKLTNGGYMEVNRTFQVDYDIHMKSFKIEWLSVFYDEDDLDSQIRHFRLFYGGIQELLLYNVKETRRLLSKTQSIIAKNEAMITELQNTVFDLTTELNTLRAQQSAKVLAEEHKDVPVDIASIVTEELFKEISKRAEQKPKEFLVLLNKVQSDILFNSLDINNVVASNNVSISNNVNVSNNDSTSQDETSNQNEVSKNEDLSKGEDNSVVKHNNKFSRFEKFNKPAGHKKKSLKAKKHRHKTDELKINLSNLDEEDAYKIVLSKWQENEEQESYMNGLNQNEFTQNDEQTQNDVDASITKASHFEDVLERAIKKDLGKIASKAILKDASQNEVVPDKTVSNTMVYNEGASEEDVPDELINEVNETVTQDNEEWTTSPTVMHYDEYDAVLLNGDKLFDLKFETPLKTVLPNNFFWYDGSMPVMEWFDTYRKELRKYPNFYKQLKEEASFCNTNYTRGSYLSLILYLKGATIEEMQNLLKRDKPMANVDSLQGSLPALYLISGCGAKANRTIKGKKQVVNKRCIDILKGFGVNDIPEAILNSFSPRNFHTHTVVSVKNLDVTKETAKEAEKKIAFEAFQKKLAMLSKDEQDRFVSMLKKESKKIG